MVATEFEIGLPDGVLFLMKIPRLASWGSLVFRHGDLFYIVSPLLKLPPGKKIFKMLEPLTLFRFGDLSLKHTPIRKHIQEIHGYEDPLLFFKEHPATAYEICMRTEEKLIAAHFIGRYDQERRTEPDLCVGDHPRNFFEKS